MMLGLDAAARDEACMFAPKTEDEGTVTGGAEDGAAANDPGEEPNACDGLKAGADEHALPDTVTVVVDSNMTVLMPSGPVKLKVDVPFDAPALGVTVEAEDGEAMLPPTLTLAKELAVGVPEEDKGVKDTALEGGIPPKLNVPVGDEELNWRLFRLMTGGGSGALRSITGGEATGWLRLITGGEAVFGLRSMTGGLPGPPGEIIS
jgi:hypothetical protein